MRTLGSNLRFLIGCMVFAPPRSWKIQELAQRILRGPRLTTINLCNGAPFVCWTSEKYYWFGGRYESNFRQHLESTLNADAVFYDIGAHAGFWPVMLSEKCKRIFAFEPSPQNFSRLSENVRPFPNVTPVNSVVSDVSQLLPYVENGTRSGVVHDGQLRIQSIRVDDFVAAGNAPPSTIKIDVEGHGAHCLAGMARTIQNYSPKLLVEVHNSEEKKALVALKGYSTKAIGTDEEFPYHVIAVPTPKG